MAFTGFKLQPREPRPFAYRTPDGHDAEWYTDQLPQLIIREDGRVESICEHGVGHPVGHVRKWDPAWMGIHGCCGCCAKRFTLPAGAEETKG